MSSESTPAAKRRKLDLTEDVAVLVGPAEKRFTIHKDTLVKHSTFFQAALNGQFKEAKDEVVKLPEVDPKIFAIYAQWAYSKDLVFTEPQTTQNVNDMHAQRKLILETYRLADVLGSLQCQNQLIDEYIAIGSNLPKRIPSVMRVNWAYENLPEHSMMRKVMVDYYIDEVRVTWLEENTAMFPRDFLADLAVGYGKAVSKSLNSESPSAKGRCYYHVHNEEVPACSTSVEDRETAE